MKVAVLGAGRIGSFRARVLKGLPDVDEMVVGLHELVADSAGAGPKRVA